jgi:hypothetical protein
MASLRVSGSRPAGHDLHHVVDDHVAKGAHRIVEMAAILHPEALRHRDLDRREVVAVPDRLQHRVREPQVEDLDQAHLAQEVIDPIQLGLVDVPVELVGECARGGAVVAKRLLDHHTRALGQTRVGKALDDCPEQKRRDLEIEDGAPCVLDRGGHALEGRRVPEITRNVGEPGGEPVEGLLVHRLACGLDRVAGMLAQVVGAPLVDGHSDDRTAQQAAALQVVERAEGHHLRQVAGDAEDDEHVGPCAVGLGSRWRVWHCHEAHRA